MKSYVFVTISSPSLLSPWDQSNVDRLASDGYIIEAITHINNSNVVLVCMSKDEPS